MRPRLRISLGFTLLLLNGLGCVDPTPPSGEPPSLALEAALSEPNLQVGADIHGRFRLNPAGDRFHAELPLAASTPFDERDQFDRAHAQRLRIGAAPHRFELLVGAIDDEVYVRSGTHPGVTLTATSGPFVFGPGILRNDSVTYYSTDGAAKVLTAIREGVKEDLILTHSAGDELAFEWSMTLEPGLIARRDVDGSVGIYTRNDEDPAIRGRSPTEFEPIYRIPPPVVRVNTGAQPAQGTHAHLELRANVLRLVASGLDALAYPINIDPTVVVIGVQDSALVGNNEGGVEVKKDQVARGKPAEGVGAWRFTNSFPTRRKHPASVAYNGYLYVIGGDVPGPGLSDVQVAPIYANGTLGSWISTTSLPTYVRQPSCSAYDGYLYVLGSGLVRVARIEADGTVRAWMVAADSQPWTGQVVASNGYLYVLGEQGDFFRVAAINANGTLGPWKATTNLPAGLLGPSSVAYNDYLYVLGGSDDDVSNRVHMAHIKSDGTLGSWVETSAFSGGRQYQTAVAYNGALYVLGGEGPFADSDVQWAPISANGTLGAWKATTGFAIARSRHSSAVYNGFLYLLGGLSETAGLLDDVQVANIDVSSRMGAGLGEWKSVGSLPERPLNTSVAHKGFLYVFSGSNRVEGAPIEANGSLGPWTAATSLPSSGGASSSVAHDGILYVLGPGVSGNNQVLLAPMSTNGELGAWTATSGFAGTRYSHTSLVYGSFVYVLGGHSSNTTQFDDVQVAPIKQNGTLGAWQPTAGFATARQNHASAAYNGYIYVLGGINYPLGGLTDVQFAAIRADGTLGAWKATSSLPSACAGHVSVAYNGALTVLGCYATNSFSTLAAPINADGTLGAWAASTELPTRRTYPNTGFVSNGRLYVVGGSGPSGEIYDVLAARLLSPEPVGVYSRLVDLRSEVLIDSITIDGSRSTPGVVHLAYRTAPASAVFGGLIDKGVVQLGSSVALDRTVGRYLRVRLTLDDVGVATTSNERDVTNLTVTYYQPLGMACSSGADCGSGNCADGVCCNVACGGACDACNLQGSVGLCTLSPNGAQGAPTCAPEVCSGRVSSCPARACGCSTAEGSIAIVLLVIATGLDGLRRTRPRTD